MARLSEQALRRMEHRLAYAEIPMLTAAYREAVAEHDRLRAALEAVAGEEPGTTFPTAGRGESSADYCGACERMQAAAAAALRDGGAAGRAEG
jgi:hypothetical protein